MVILNKIVLYIAHTRSQHYWQKEDELESSGGKLRAEAIIAWNVWVLGRCQRLTTISGTGSLFVILCCPILILIIHFNSLWTCGYILGSIYGSRFSYGFSEKSLASPIPPSFHLLTCPPLPNPNLPLPVHNFRLRPYTSAFSFPSWPLVISWPLGVFQMKSTYLTFIKERKLTMFIFLGLDYLSQDFLQVHLFTH